jgi:general secretion pathway protein A
MNAKKLLSLWGLKWNPFSPELPSEGLLVTASDRELRLARRAAGPGGRLRADLGRVGNRASRWPADRRRTPGRAARRGGRGAGAAAVQEADFYRELGDIFSVKLSPSNRWGGFKALRERWRPIWPSRIKPVLLIDEAQEMAPEVLSELRMLSSADFDATSLLTVVLSGDGRLPELLRHPDLIPLGTRIRTRLNTEAPRARNSANSSARLGQGRQRHADDAELMDTLVDHAAGNYRLLMTMGGELLAYGMARGSRPTR